MPGCVFHVSGEAFDVDTFLSGSTLCPYQTHHRGEVGLRSRVFADSGFKLAVSSADGDLKAEVADAITFLSTHETELQRLHDDPGTSDLRLDFGYWRRNTSVQCDYLPPELLARAGKLGIGIALSLYPECEPEASTG